MSWWRKWFGPSKAQRAATGPSLPPFGPLVTELACWRVTHRQGGAQVTVRFGLDAAGQHGVVMTGDPAVCQFLDYYLADPLGSRPIHLEGRGPRSGPHTRDPEQFEAAMARLPMYFAVYDSAQD